MGSFLVEGIPEENKDGLDIIMKTILNPDWEKNLAKSKEFPDGHKKYKVGMKQVYKVFFQGEIPLEILIATQKGILPFTNSAGDKRHLIFKPDFSRRCDCSFAGHVAAGCPLKRFSEENKKLIKKNLKELFNKRQANEKFRHSKKESFENKKISKNSSSQKMKEEKSNEKTQKSYKNALMNSDKKSEGPTISDKKSEVVEKEKTPENKSLTKEAKKNEVTETSSKSSFPEQKGLGDNDSAKDTDKGKPKRGRPKKGASNPLKSSDIEMSLSQVEEKEIEEEKSLSQDLSQNIPPDKI